MRSSIVSTPRPVPDRRLPALAGAAVLVLALPLFLLAGWRISGWALGATIWLGAQAIGLLVTRLKPQGVRLAGSGVLAFGMMFRAVAIMVVVIALAGTDPGLALAAAGLYALAYTMELGLSLAAYFGAPAR